MFINIISGQGKTTLSQMMNMWFNNYDAINVCYSLRPMTEPLTQEQYQIKKKEFKELLRNAKIFDGLGMLSIECQMEATVPDVRALCAEIFPKATIFEYSIKKRTPENIQRKRSLYERSDEV